MVTDNCHNDKESPNDANNKSNLNLFPLKPDLRANNKIESLCHKIASLNCAPLLGRSRGFHYDDLELRRHNLQNT
jgi:hypothetical protein